MTFIVGSSRGGAIYWSLLLILKTLEGKKNLIFKMYIFIQALSLYSLTLSNFLSFTWVFLLSLGQFSSDSHFTKPYTEATLAHTHSLLDYKVF